MTQYAYDQHGIYRCVICGKPFEPGHSVMCKGEIAVMQPRKVVDFRDVDLVIGMGILHSCEEND